MAVQGIKVMKEREKGAKREKEKGMKVDNIRKFYKDLSIVLKCLD